MSTYRRAPPACLFTVHNVTGNIVPTGTPSIHERNSGRVQKFHSGADTIVHIKTVCKSKPSCYTLSENVADLGNVIRDQ